MKVATILCLLDKVCGGLGTPLPESKSKQRAKQAAYSKKYELSRPSRSRATMSPDVHLAVKARAMATRYSDRRKTARVRMLAIATRCQKHGLAFDLPIEFFENAPTHCPQCGSEFQKNPRLARASVDRNSPTLGYVVGNCEWLCVRCNLRKNDQTWAEMLDFATRGFERNKI